MSVGFISAGIFFVEKSLKMLYLLALAVQPLKKYCVIKTLMNI